MSAGEVSHNKKLSNIDNYNKNPKLCLFCDLPILYDKRVNNFCNHSCCASFNSPNIIKNLENPWHKNCANCGKEITGIKFCSRDCQKLYNWKETSRKILSDGYDTSSNHRTARKLLIELNKGACQICKLSEWMGKPMPLVLDHISGNSEDGSLSNLRVICNNCDAQTDTYKSKNNGNGRARRRKRYQEGKSY